MRPGDSLPRWTPILGLSLLLAPGTSACVFRTVQVEQQEPRAGYAVSTPIKAHLRDGQTVVFADGARVESGALVGSGSRYDLTVQFAGPVSAISLDSIVGLETFRTDTNTGASIGATTLAVAGTAAAVGLAAVAIFGSCPTVYSDSAGVPYLESETFSYSIAPIFEGRDVDRLRTGTDEAGRVRLDVRNEALETHYVNHLSLMDVEHSAQEIAVPDPTGAPVLLSQPLRISGATDLAGGDVHETLASRDGMAFQSDERAFRAALALERPARDELRDALEVEIPVPSGTTEIGLVLTLRNSLFSTVLFYDVMLGRQGARALDWLGRDLNRISDATELGLWVVQNLGLHVEVWDEGWRSVGRLADTGPIAWKDVAFIVPAGDGDSLRLRLTFPMDSWRIDRVAAFGSVRRGSAKQVPAARILEANGSPLDDALASLEAVDDRYLVTRPGQQFFVEFDPDLSSTTLDHTYFLVSHGYYDEWIRPAWIAESPEAEPFRPGDDTLREALKLWWTMREDMEARFFGSRVPMAMDAGPSR